MTTSHSSTRRAWLQGALLGSAALAAPAILTRPANAAEFAFKLATTIPPNHPINAHAQRAADVIAEQSGGRLKLDVYPGYMLGSSTSALSQLRSGGLELVTLSGSVLSTLAPVTTIYNTAFAFKDYDQVWQALDGALGEHLRKRIAAVGLHAFDKQWDLGFRHITSGSKPIRGPADLRETKIRVPVAPLFVACFKALGAAPTPINFDELYTALQTKVVDAQENDLLVVQTGKLYEVQKNCALTGHIWDGYFTLTSARTLKTLPADLRTILETNLNKAAIDERAEVRSRTDAVRKEVEAAGLAFNEVDRDAFRAVLKKSGFYGEMRAKFGDETWAILESTVGPLA
ncbi:hypothetical protein OPKNFCMD_4928 [Methylobacterium crusticola]|uniref:TRAP transporter substrate-binding protein n=1 Tax=Methylobacterium crusticola TaxID=1697972 RepID=A0ABQ4R4E7_9HYPH|nr:TRAP transporter substrate-binding protein [Methylobacterium crusticola]GJD52166.1 hypothetical protein OPKNFCMD_4928 [Methylobacterium crusticola]